ncbi:thioredoxin-dependent thiol peroxidase [Oricola thermophila]|uniref:thioredoxin-dependent peroxiredoxin n=1 Tax=Oricola thermophila TaxID=2742145 RepID=A0A6N1V9W7_9HYPH|nr:thioredoxin-dependent thiol peroxidase [Oricola thermophila]QKV17801.1 thioredoxin-dependent thiol peroxidase [Oricola thermophila]
MTQIAEGSIAPDFSLPAGDGTTVNLASMRGKIVVLYFYPKDDTSGCTREAVDFTTLKPEFDTIGAVILGVSPDNPTRHEKFSAKHDLAITLISDEEKSAAQAYGVWVEKSMYGRKYMGIERSTFLVDREGRIARAWRKVKVAGHAAEVLAAARELA